MAGISRVLLCNPSESSALLCPRLPVGLSLSIPVCLPKSDLRHFSTSFCATRSYKWVCSETKKRAAGHMMRALGAEASQILPFTAKTSPSEELLKIWRSADAVCFDVDSTVCIDEGIDELAEFCGAGEAVAAWTARAMGGSVPFEEALAARLSLFKPSKSDVANFLHRNPPSLNPGIQDLVQNLKAKGVDVYLVSGGFRQMIEPVAELLEIPPKSIYANRLLFGSAGEFVGFDPEEPTSRSGGKATAVAQIKKEHGYKTLVMVGDGATDLEASMDFKNTM
ncbi:phosphoserine phosphatase, chloroplastic isoform X2 [Cryptomeria japonica]|uniref:phosphoserine phosphatase, chloroplastic isoform X2 n=1 Tax=Cryptomeria japonica TaxID=3369 RepID=UPI0025ACA903|nr:phosphoserine phosphatase, chloroplastic isoform X2 [Cryptomeria japonica]